MIQLQYFNGEEWFDIGEPWENEWMAWVTLGGDNLNYRTINIDTGEVLTSKEMVLNRGL